MDLLEEYKSLSLELDANAKVINALMQNVTEISVRQQEILSKMGDLFVEDTKERQNKTKLN